MQDTARVSLEAALCVAWGGGGDWYFLLCSPPFESLYPLVPLFQHGFLVNRSPSLLLVSASLRLLCVLDSSLK